MAFNLEHLLKEDLNNRLCKIYKTYSGSLLLTENKAYPELDVNGSCLKKTYVYDGSNVIGERCELDTWTQTMEDNATRGNSIFVNNYSIQFDGVDEYCTGGDLTDYDKDTAFSVSLWVNPQNVNAERCLFSKATGTGTLYGWFCNHSATGAVKFEMRTTSETRSHTSNLTIAAGAWYHVVITYSGAANLSGVRVYVNGTVGTTPSAGAFTATMLSGTQDFIVGARGGSTQYFSGNLDEVAVFNKALSQSEVTELYNSGSPNDLEDFSDFNSIVHWWRMGDGDTYPTITDNIAAGDLTLTNGVSGDIETNTP